MARQPQGLPGQHRHFIARENGETVGYGAIEKNNNCHRLFLVVSWARPGATAIADALIDALCHDSPGLGQVRMLEYADDKPFLDFLQTRGFTILGGLEDEGMAVARLAHANFC
jgi:hypothetical protein